MLYVIYSKMWLKLSRLERIHVLIAESIAQYKNFSDVHNYVLNESKSLIPSTFQINYVQFYPMELIVHQHYYFSSKFHCVKLLFLHTSVQIHCQQLNPWDIPLSWNNETNNKTLFYLNKQRVNWLDIHVTQIEFGQGRIINFLRSVNPHRCV